MLSGNPAHVKQVTTNNLTMTGGRDPRLGAWPGHSPSVSSPCPRATVVAFRSVSSVTSAPDQWTIFTSNSFGHSLPVTNSRSVAAS
jgi:hypothetical protein